MKEVKLIRLSYDEIEARLQEEIAAFLVNTRGVNDAALEQRYTAELELLEQVKHKLFHNDHTAAIIELSAGDWWQMCSRICAELVRREGRHVEGVEVVAKSRLRGRSFEVTYTEEVEA